MPTNWDPAYTAPFTITETTTVKAVARVNDIYSDVAEMTFTKEESGVTGSTIADLATTAKSQDNVTLVLNNAKVGEAPKKSGVALPGSVVTVYYDDDQNDTETFLIATRQEGVTDGKLEVYSPNSPLGHALIDAKVGEERSYTVPSGATVKVTLVKAEPYHA